MKIVTVCDGLRLVGGDWCCGSMKSTVCDAGRRRRRKRHVAIVFQYRAEIRLDRNCWGFSLYRFCRNLLVRWLRRTNGRLQLIAPHWSVHGNDCSFDASRSAQRLGTTRGLGRGLGITRRLDITRRHDITRRLGITRRRLEVERWMTPHAFLISESMHLFRRMG